MSKEKRRSKAETVIYLTTHFEFHTAHTTPHTPIVDEALHSIDTHYCLSIFTFRDGKLYHHIPYKNEQRSGKDPARAMAAKPE